MTERLEVPYRAPQGRYLRGRPVGREIRVGSRHLTTKLESIIPFFAFATAVRRVIYTTNAIESINARLRKINKTWCHFHSDAAITKLIWPGLSNITAEWGRVATESRNAMNQFAIAYGDRYIHDDGDHACRCKRFSPSVGPPYRRSAFFRRPSVLIRWVFF